MNFKFEYLNAQSAPVTTNKVKPQNETEIKYQIQKFSMEGNRSYDIHITAELSNNSLISSEIAITVFIEKTELLTFIEGGNRYNGYENELKVEGTVKDLDVQESQQTVGINVSWKCEDLMN